jgi:hypothetical protein
MVERRKLMVELQGLMQSTAPNRDENILARLRALDEGADSGAAEMRKAYQDLDAVLTPGSAAASGCSKNNSSARRWI